MEWIYILDNRVDDQGKKLWEAAGNRGRVKENSWRGRREERAMISKRSLGAEQGQRFWIFLISVAF